MGKRHNNEAPNPNAVPNRDIIQRLNFLYQASTYLNGLGAHQTVVGPSGETLALQDKSVIRPQNQLPKRIVLGKQITGDDKRQRSGKRKATTNDLARSYVKSMKIIGQKTNVKIDPSIKRTLCRGCNNVLMPGLTAAIRVKPLPSHGHAINYTCMNCNASRRIPAPPILGESSQLSTSAPQSTAHLATGNCNAMEVDPMRHEVDKVLDTVVTEATPKAEGKTPPSKQPPRASKKKPTKPRPLPFFARQGHLLFVGNELVGETER